METTEKRHHVYFIYEYPNLDKFKIGRSINPFSRLKNLQTGNSRTLKIHSLISCPSKEFSKGLEAALHTHYLQSCAGGEWFFIQTEEIVKSITVANHLSTHDLPTNLFEEVWDFYFLDKKGSQADKRIKYDIPYIPVKT